MKRLCIFHSADHDGQCSAAIVKYKYDDVKLIGWDYGHDIPWEEIKSSDEVILVDLMFQPYEEMVKLSKLTKLTWIDHHASAIKLAKENPINCESVLEEGIGACVLTWKYYFPHQEVPYGVQLLGEYDVWNHSDKNCLPFEYGLKINITNPISKNYDKYQIWEHIFEDSWYGGPEDGGSLIDLLCDNGHTILKYVKNTFKHLASSYCYEKEIDGFKFLVANNPHRTSQYFDSIWDETKYDGMISYFWNGKCWTVSLYSYKNGVDVSRIAIKYGGGGHKQAAGFSSNDINWLIKGGTQWAQHGK